MTTLTLVDALDTLQERLVRLDGALPSQRNDDEREAMTAMESCAHELRRLALLVEPARRQATTSGAEQEQALAELHHLLHDLRTPAGVLYTYLKIVADGQLFACSAPAQRAEALSLSALVRDIREQA